MSAVLVPAVPSHEWAGHLSGNVGLDSFDVSWTTLQTPTNVEDPHGVSAAFQYGEFVCANLETLVGFASGVANGLAAQARCAAATRSPASCSRST